MRLSRSAPLLALASLGLVLGLAWRALERTSPGPLSAAHARLPELSDPQGCAACHGGWLQPLADACARCHARIPRDLAEGRGLHGTLPSGVDAGRCGDCHREHLGAEAQLVTRASWTRAGVPDPGAYDHAALAFALGGRHAALACDACHPAAAADPLPAGSARFGGLEQRCDACHGDPHEGRMARACADCHGQEQPFAEVQAFRHADGFDDSGPHAGLACAACHDPASERSVEALAGAGAAPPTRACGDCHDSPHAMDFVLGTAARLDATPAASCAACHPLAQGGFARPPAMAPALHDASGFPLAAPHASLACERCHAPAGAPFAERHAPRPPEACAACHADAHEGQFARGPLAGVGCLGCHERERFVPPAFGVEHHAATAFPLTGSHLAVACEACHARPGPGAPRAFHGTGSACADCHADAHEGRLAAPAARACEGCHTTTTFAALDRDAFDHARWTAFALEGAHARAACASCHERGGESAGGAPARAPVPDACADCHADPHGGQFARPVAGSADVAPRTDCAACHDAAAFAPARPGFDHALWTGWDTGGVHARVACGACHPPRAEPDRLGRRTLLAAGRACADCHADPHAGQFAVGGATDCGACHAEQGTLAFSHERTRFPLDARHARLDCGACHRPWPLSGGGSVVRYRPLGTACGDCHAAETSAGTGRKSR